MSSSRVAPDRLFHGADVRQRALGYACRAFSSMRDNPSRPFGGQLEELRSGRPLFTVDVPPSEQWTAGSPRATVVLVHGAADTHARFAPQIAALRDAGYFVCTADALGCGQSPAPDDWEAYAEDEVVADWAAVYARAAGRTPERPVFLVGHSFGTCVAAKLAGGDQGRPSAAGDELAGLALMCPGDPEPGSDMAPAKLRNAPVWMLEMGLSEVQNLMEGFFYSSEASRELIEVERTRTNYAGRMHAIQAFWCQMHWKGFREALAAVAQPTLIVCGESDKLTPPKLGKRVADRLQDGLADVRVVDGAAHMPMVEAPDTVNSLLLEHFDACMAARS